MTVVEAHNRLIERHSGKDVTVVSFTPAFDGTLVAYVTSGMVAGYASAEERVVFFDKDGQTRFDMFCS